MTADQKAQGVLQKSIDDGKIPGVQYMVLSKQGVEFEFNGGLRDLASGQPVTADTTFMSASSTKVITALAVLQLEDGGSLSLDDPLSKHYGDHPYGEEITIRQLVVHTSGVPNPMPVSWLHPVEQHDGYEEELELQRVLKANPKLKSSPGTKYRYTNLGYWLLSKVIENAAQLSYSDYLRKHVFDGLDISSSDMDCSIPALDNHAVGYIKRFSMANLMFLFIAPKFVLGDSVGSWKSFQPLYMNGMAYGGLMGKARGWGSFLSDQLQDTSKIMSPEVKHKFYQKQRSGDGKDLGMSLGWHLGLIQGHEYYSKPGGGPGFSSNIRVYPKRGLASVWLKNHMEVSESPIQRMSDLIDPFFLGR